jgi:hypothetical protein
MNEAVRALSAEAVTAQAERHIDEYLDGGYDLEAEDIQAALAAGVDPGVIKASWAHAKSLRPKAASFILPGTQPKIDKAPAPSVPSWRRTFSRRLGAEPEPAEPEPWPEAEPQPKIDRPSPIEPSKALVVAQVVLPVSSKDYTIAAMNEHHAVIDNVGGKTVIACWEPSPLDASKLVVVFQTKESFLLRYSNRRVSLDVPGGRTYSIRIGQYWLEHRDRRQYRGVTFAPAGPKVLNECLNLWQGWGVDAKPGDWGLIRRHIEEVLAGGNEEFADYIIRWIAWAIQHPDQQAEVALVLIGAKGAGKGTLARCLQPIFGAHAFQVTSREEVIGKFNGHLQDCILFVADEAYWGGDKRCVGRLQGMITEPTLPIERKGIDVVQVRNYLHVVMLAEPGWVIPAGRYERRYAAFAVSTSKRGNKAYFAALHRQMSAGGIEAMLYDLRKMELDDWHPRDIPEAVLTSLALQKQQGHTLPPLEQWYVMLLHNGVLPGALAGRPSTAFTKSLIDDARARVPRLRELTEVALRNFLIDEESIGVACTKYRASFGNGWTFPPLAEAREAWARRYGPVQWDHASAEGWGTRKPPQSLLDRRA